MENLFDEFVSRRCADALLQCHEYMEKEYSGLVPEDELQCQAEKLCYIQGIKDALYFAEKLKL